MQGQVPPSASGITRTANHTNNNPLAIPGCRAREEEGKVREVNMLQQPNSCNPIPAQEVGELVTPHLPSLHSSLLHSHFALPYLLAGDKTHELQPPACSPQQTPWLLYREHYWASLPAPALHQMREDISPTFSPQPPKPHKETKWHPLITAPRAAAGHVPRPPASQPIGARLAGSARVPKAGVGPCGGWDR